MTIPNAMRQTDWRQRHLSFCCLTKVFALLHLPAPRCAIALFFGATFSMAEEQAIVAFLDRHCMECHDEQTSEGDLNLLDLAFAPDDAANRARWVRVHDRISSGEMPPPEKADGLTKEDRAKLVHLLGGELHVADRTEIEVKGRGPLRRLTRVEYENRLRDLLAMPHLDIRDKLPEDRDSHGFTKVSRLLDLSRVQLEAWLNAAEAALLAATAVSDAPVPPTSWRFTGTDLFPGLDTFGERQAMFFAKEDRMVPIDGNRFKEMTPEERRDPELEMALFRSATWPYYGYPRGFRAPHDGAYHVRFSARAVRQLNEFRLVPATESVAMSFRSRQPSGPDVSGDVRETGGWMDLGAEPKVFETTIRLKKGETFEYSPLGLPVPFIRTDGGFFYSFPPMPPDGHPGIAIQWLEVAGPVVEGEWPPASHRVLYDDLPLTKGGVTSGNPAVDVPRLLRRFVERAAVAPVPEEVIAGYEARIHEQLAAGATFAEAMRHGYGAFLSSGHFVFLTEPKRDAHAIAARLSHFLTGTAPDETLRRLANEGRASEPDVLRAEVSRLIGDDRFDRFVVDFTDQWLNLRRLRRDQSDDRLYPEYRRDDYLVGSMEKETRAFFTAMVKENLPVTTLVDSDFTYVNDRLARHYGLPPVEGSTMRRVALPEASPYGGIMTQASVLKITSNGTTTSPVVRGVWTMEKILGSPPPPPPKSIPAIEPDIRGATTVRELLAKHTEVKSCAACHAHFDPVGFALENFDIMGAWRDDYRGMEKGEKVTGIDRAGHPYTYYISQPVDPSGELLDGSKFGNVRELKAILRNEPRLLARNLVHHLALYATGTPVRFADRPEVEAILDRTADQGYRVRDLIEELVVSELFTGLPTEP